LPPGIPLFCGFAEKCKRFGEAFRRAPSLFNHVTQPALTGRIALFCRQPVPFHRLGIILGRPFAGFMQISHFPLGRGVPLPGGQTIPLRRFSKTLPGSFPVFVHFSDGKLRRRVSG
jgi:hypothetical protein